MKRLFLMSLPKSMCVDWRWAKHGPVSLWLTCLILFYIVVWQGQILSHHEDAKYMLQALSDSSHQVMSAVALVTTTQEKVSLSVSTVYFRQLTETEIEAYIATGEPLDKAGSYAIQGLASIFIERLEGSYSGVMGLPLFETATLLEEVGIQTLKVEG